MQVFEALIYSLLGLNSDCTLNLGCTLPETHSRPPISGSVFRFPRWFYYAASIKNHWSSISVRMTMMMIAMIAGNLTEHPYTISNSSYHYLNLPLSQEEVLLFSSLQRWRLEKLSKATQSRCGGDGICTFNFSQITELAPSWFYPNLWGWGLGFHVLNLCTRWIFLILKCNMSEPCFIYFWRDFFNLGLWKWEEFAQQLMSLLSSYFGHHVRDCLYT